MILTTEELSRVLAGGGRQPDHAAGDPHQGAAQGRHRGAEAEVAAADRRRRDHGRHLGDRAQHRLRRRVGASAAPSAAEVGGARATSSTAPRRGARSPAAPTCSRCSRAPIPNPKSGARGLSLFIVPKDAFPGHEFEMTQPGGGTLHGKADAHARLPRHALVHARLRELLRARPRTWSARRAGSARASTCR